MMMYRKHTYFIIAGIFVLIILFVLLFPIKKELVFKFQDSNKVLAYLDLKDAKQFSILYTHSIHLTPVLESYKINTQDEIVQTDLTYESFNVGMPSNAEGNEKFVMENGKYHIENMDRHFPYIDLRVGQVVANHRLVLKNGKLTIPFKQFVKPGTWVRIQVDKITLWELVEGGHVLE